VLKRSTFLDSGGADKNTSYKRRSSSRLNDTAQRQRTLTLCYLGQWCRTLS